MLSNAARRLVAGQLTSTDRDIIAVVKAMTAANTEDEMRAALAGTVAEGTTATGRDLHMTALGILTAEAAELVGIIRRLTGEDL